MSRSSEIVAFHVSFVISYDNNIFVKFFTAVCFLFLTIIPME